jgi:hypothetical protein
MPARDTSEKQTLAALGMISPSAAIMSLLFPNTKQGKSGYWAA